MPLHLLQKKSWNVYNPASIARVRADEAVAAAREEAEDQRQQEWDAQRRLAILRGEPEPAPLEPLRDPEYLEDGSRRKRSREEDHGRDEGRKERKRMMRQKGEDDTDRDIRVARTKAGVGQDGDEHDDRRVVKYDRERGKDAPIVDHAGHIQLFAPPETKELQKGKNVEAEAEKKRKEQELEDQYTMRFSNAAGFKTDAKGKPWYAARANAYSGTEELDDKMIAAVGEQRAIASSGKNAFGRDDEGRAKRDESRMKSADPMAAMKSAQTKLKQVEREREQSKRERETELKEIARMQDRQEREDARNRKRRRKGKRDNNGLDRLESNTVSHGEDSREYRTRQRDHSRNHREGSRNHMRDDRRHHDKDRQELRIPKA